jgi:hypothetical protein
LDKAAIVQAVGAVSYAEASEHLRELAISSDYGSKSAAQGSNLPHKVSDYLWDSELRTSEKIALFFDFYDDLPSYGLLMYAKDQYSGWSSEERTQWWTAYRARITAAIAAPLTYALWCDFFEDSETVLCFQRCWERRSIISVRSILSRRVP